MENLHPKDITEYTSRQPDYVLRPMLEHLIDYEPPIVEADETTVSLKKARPSAIVSAQQATADWLATMGAPTEGMITDTGASLQAQSAFTAIAKPLSEADQRKAILQLNTPPAVRKLVGMLTAYDWAFVEQAKEIRGYAVAKILEEVEHPDARIRLRALELLGKVTEVALFTDRVEVKRTALNDEELDAKIKEKLSRFVGVVDIEPQDAVVLDTDASSDTRSEATDASA